MVYNLKALILALLAVLAMSAVVASAAQAAGKFTTTGTKITAEAGEVQLLLPAVKSSGTCGAAALQSAVINGIEGVDMVPIYAECNFFGESKSTFDINDCTYPLYNLQTDGATKEYLATMDLKCPSGKVMVITAPGIFCRVTLLEKKNLEHVRLTNEPGSKPVQDVTMKTTLSGLKYKVENYNGGNCTQGTGEGEDGSWSVGSYTFDADNALGETVGLQISD